jgi:hypothetical protein
MKNWIGIVVLVAVVASLGAQNAKKPRNVFSTLKVGQSVSLKDHGSAWSISFFDDEIRLSHTVVEVGEDFVVVRDIAGVKDTTVPVFAVKAIEKVRLKLRKRGKAKGQ